MPRIHRRYHQGCSCRHCAGVRQAHQEIASLNRHRVARGLCRHCGDPTPCGSVFGDSAPGVKNTPAALRHYHQPPQKGSHAD